MGNSIKVVLSDGTEEVYDESRGESYRNTVRYKGLFVIVQDVWGNECAYPERRISKVIINNGR